jgi:hypothetical protein
MSTCDYLAAPARLGGKEVKLDGVVTDNEGKFTFEASCPGFPTHHIPLRWKAGAVPPASEWAEYYLPKAGEQPGPNNIPRLRPKPLDYGTITGFLTGGSDARHPVMIEATNYEKYHLLPM